MYRFNKTLLLAEIETNYGTDPTPTGAANAIMATDLKIEPMYQQKTRSHVLPGMGSPAPINVGDMIKATFKVDMTHPQSAANVVPNIDCLLQACGLTYSEPNTGVDCLYTPSELLDSDKSVTIHGYRDGVRFVAKGCRGNVKISATAGEIGVLEFEFTGLYDNASVSAQTFPTPTFSVETPLVFQGATITWDGTSRVLQNFSIDLGNQVVPRTSAAATVGKSAHLITNREPVATAQFEAVALGTLNFWTALEASQTKAFVITIPFSSHEIVLTMPAAFIKKINEVDSNNYVAYNLDLDLKQSSGNDAITILYS